MNRREGNEVRLLTHCLVLVFVITVVAALRAGTDGTIAGTVKLADTGEPLPGGEVTILELDRRVFTNEEGGYHFANVPPGRYHVVAHLSEVFTQDQQIARVHEGATLTLDFLLKLEAIRHEITVSASGRRETAFESFQAVRSLNSFELAANVQPMLGDVLGNSPGTGIAKRSFGPGTTRPIIRGFDGDRVLVMEDGMRTGSVASTSGDHGEVFSAVSMERLEVVKGPATLLYGANAMGGVVNAISRHQELHPVPHQGLRGSISVSGGSANDLAGGAAGVEYGEGKWALWAGGNLLRTDDYISPEGTVRNSATRMSNGFAGVGWFGNRSYASFAVRANDFRYGVPFAGDFHAEHGEDEHEESGEDSMNNSVEGDDHDDHDEPVQIRVDGGQQAYRFNWGLRKLGSFVEDFALKIAYSTYQHDELEVEDEFEVAGTTFTNDQFLYRGSFEQQRRGRLTGRFGFWGLTRDFEAAGVEALSPPVDHNAFALFALEEIAFERLKLQFGGRFEWNGYQTGVRQGASGPPAPDREFSGLSAAAGARFDLWRGGALVANYTRTYRAPALEELYNFGLHPGILAFEVGDPTLNAEVGNGFDLSLRQRTERVQGELNLFHYRFDDFVFPFLTGEEVEGLPVNAYGQTDSRFIGAEANLDFLLRPRLWLNLGADFVDAQETGSNTPLPRIPPLRARVGLDWRWNHLEVKPELILANAQSQTFPTETRTPGYTAVGLKATYSIPAATAVHQLSFDLFNIGDRLYRNHSSFIKDMAPEIGRGIRFTYMVRFF